MVPWVYIALGIKCSFDLRCLVLMRSGRMSTLAGVSTPLQSPTSSTGDQDNTGGPIYLKGGVMRDRAGLNAAFGDDSRRKPAVKMYRKNAECLD